AGKLTETREDTLQNRQAMEERIATLAANVSSLAGKLLEVRDESGRQSHMLESRVVASERAIEHLETDRVASAALEARFTASENAIERLEGSHVSNISLEPEMQRQSTALKDLADTVETLGQKIPAVDSKLSSNFARLDSVTGGRLLSLESKLAEV